MTADRIAVLPEALANQIAAGEVVERPASVVKELCENAIDAEATRIDVEVEAGGVGAVTVTDDGVGMSSRDAETALLRHATSKLARAEDLFAIASFGFRGEALPSIASVSRLRLETRRRGDLEGTAVSIEGGGTPSLAPIGTPPGTRVSVRDLFFNVPARRKFLKALPTESAHLTEVVESLALGYPSVAVHLARDGRPVRAFVRQGTREDRVRDVLGGETLARCAGERGHMRVEAFLSPPERSRAGAGSLAMFVNGRPVKDRALARAVAHAYGSVLEPGRYPIGALFLDLPFDRVDVNVHPQKSEVRFAEGRAAYDVVFRVLEGELGRAFHALSTPRGASGPARWPAPRVDGAPGKALELPVPKMPEPGVLPFDDRAIAPQPYGFATHLRDATGTPVSALRGLRFLAQLRLTFLLCEGEDALVILDQHAAAERVAFHRLTEARRARGVPMQRLLVPHIVKLGAAEVALLDAVHGAALEMGIDVRAATDDSVAVRAVPAMMASLDPEKLVRELASELGDAGARGVSAAADKMLATLACHGSIRAGDRISAEDARALLAALAEVDFGGHCPHGRPIVTRLPFAELERRVGRT